MRLLPEASLSVSEQPVAQKTGSKAKWVNLNCNKCCSFWSNVCFWVQGEAVGYLVSSFCPFAARLSPINTLLHCVHCCISFLINYPCLWSAVNEDTSLRNTWVAIWYLLLSVELRLTVTGGNNGWRSNNGFWRNNTRRKPRLLWIQNKTFLDTLKIWYRCDPTVL